MFLHYLNNDLMICDFQLIYDTDSKLQFDYYAYGLINEVNELEIDANYNYMSYGMVSIKRKELELIDGKIDEICKDSKLMDYYTNRMIYRLKMLIEENKNIENLLKEENYNIYLYRRCFEFLSRVMAYRRFADKASEILAKSIHVDDISKLKLPSYLIILDNSINKLGQDSSDDEFELFIHEYGFLNSFEIEPTEYENIEALNVQYDEQFADTDEEKYLYRLSWYSEVRHIYQLRTLRNFRILMLQNKLDIFDTSAKDLFKI